MNDSGREDSGQYLLGIDLGGTYIKGALFNLTGTLLRQVELATEADCGPQHVVNRIALAAETLLTGESPVLKHQDLLGVGIGVPGNHDFANGIVIYSPNLPEWRRIPVRDWLAKRLACDIYLDNDANAAILGELWQGAGRGYRHIAMITVGTGIGGGLILNGRLYRGAAGSAGEIGHTVVADGGPVCNCGIRGHLEALTAAPWLTRRAKEALAAGRVSTLAARGALLEAKHIFQAGAEGDSLALELIAEAAHYLGIGLANLVNLLSPELIIVGGGVAKAGENLLQPIRSAIKEYALEVPAAVVKVVSAELGNSAGCYGGAALVLQEKNKLEII